MTSRSRTLFHFTKNVDVLKQILAGGFWPRYCSEDTRWVGQEDAQTIAFPMACFCDIPLSRIADHVNFYGQYGLGMTREWAIANGLNPILYIAGENFVRAELRKLNDHANRLKEEKRASAKESVRYIYAHAKPATGVMVVDGSPVEKDFYLESEWRHVPRHDEIAPYLRHDSFADADCLVRENKKTDEHCRLKFTPKDIKYIFVRSDTDIPRHHQFHSEQVGSLPSCGYKGSDVEGYVTGKHSRRRVRPNPFTCPAQPPSRLLRSTGNFNQKQNLRGLAARRFPVVSAGCGCVPFACSAAFPANLSNTAVEAVPFSRWTLRNKAPYSAHSLKR